jgi:dTDP-4-dehydrorhamnose 3,5-epimerase
MSKPRLIEGETRIDDRGQLSFVNDFSFDDVKRFYVVSNHQAGFIRAWHAHRHETKYVFVLQGAAIVGAVQIDDWKTPSRDSEVHSFVLSADKPAVLCVPSGFANGFKSLTTDTQVAFFSTATIEESQDDDIRFDSRYWDIWNVVER